MSYLAEFKVHWRALSAATIGIATGTALTITTVNLFAPALIAEFGWSKAAFALIGTLSLSLVLIVPLIGMLTDAFGVRRVVMVGIIGLPLTHLAASMMRGNIYEYFALYFLQMNLGATTTAMVYARVVALRFDAARGLALAVFASGSAALMTFALPALGAYIDHEGWRAAYRLLAAFSAVSGVVVLLLLPRDRLKPDRPVNEPKKSSRPDYRLLVRNRAFWVIAAGMGVCFMIHVLAASQFKLMLLEKGVSSSDASWLLSLLTITVIIGRFGCGLSLDRFPAHIVAVIGMALPAIGLFALASPFQGSFIVVSSVILIGLSQGAELDLLTYLVARYFDKEIYGTVVGLVYGGMSLFSTLGAVLLSYTLQLTGSFALFMNIIGVVTIFGAGLFLLLEKPTLAVPAPAH